MSDALDTCPIKFTGEVIESKGKKYPTPAKADFLQFRQFADSMTEFKLRYEKHEIFVFDRKAPKGTSHFRIIKAFTLFPGVPPELLNDVLHDPDYRAVWDDARLAAHKIVQLLPHSDIGYYAGKLPNPLSNRDFVNQRSWMTCGGGEYIIFNTSVQHADKPKVKDIVRAHSVITGTVVLPWGEGGCSLTYISQSNPKGSLPTSLVNFTTSKFTPSIMKKLRTATANYPAWLKKNRPDAVIGQQQWALPETRWDSAIANETPKFVAARMGGSDKTPATLLGSSEDCSPMTKESPSHGSVMSFDETMGGTIPPETPVKE